ncbi:uncharacterized protein LOC120350210 [Nilaparvata lugens]|uniref:uncharacterized protein LOC120350210 n=1 Tax=Nilaparvata lugens TaxID=108931 RepID=UPI00193E317C|nr:uncharacterized protein LOC120350210 [Nilaparvata lugens]
MNPQTPRLFGLPKIHKPGIPIRPVVSGINSPTSKLAYKLNILFRSYTAFKPTYSIRNSSDLIEKIQDIKLQSTNKLVSFDVKNLFTSVPVKESMNIAESIIKEANIGDNQTQDFMNCLKLCTGQDFFKFDGIFFRQVTGLAMGSPLSPLLSDIYKDNLEKQIMDSSLLCEPSWKNIKFLFNKSLFLKAVEGTTTNLLRIWG